MSPPLPLRSPSRCPRRPGTRASAPIDAVVLLPPDTLVGAFKLHARRAIVVDIQHYPFSDRGIAEFALTICEQNHKSPVSIDRVVFRRRLAFD